jgi:hypothetical protein
VTLTNSFGFGGTNATLVFRPVTASLTGLGGAVLTSALKVAGVGAVSSAGWGASTLVQAVTERRDLPVVESPRSVGSRDWHCPVRVVPPAGPDVLPKFARLRRASAVTKFAMAAALEALASAGFPNGQGAGRLGIIQCMFNGCVQFSGRFYHEVIETPALASPLIFPETVYNAPASHIAAFLGVDGPVTTLIRESSAIMEGVAMARDWLTLGCVDRVLLIGAEEGDWVGAEAVTYYHPELRASEGAGALLLSLQDSGPVLEVGSACCFLSEAERADCLKRLAEQPVLNSGLPVIHVSSLCGIPILDEAEEALHAGRGALQVLEPRSVLGESMGAGGALQLVLAAAEARDGNAVQVLLPGSLCASHAALIRP